MSHLTHQLAQGRWGLARARQIAEDIQSNPAATKSLVEALFRDQPELRKRAADVARRITDLHPTPLRPYFDQIAGLLPALLASESRTRWHLGLVVARIAHTREQRLRTARLMELLLGDESNVVRCSAVEGIALLAIGEPSLLPRAEEIIHDTLITGTKAMKCRARHARLQLERLAK